MKLFVYASMFARATAPRAADLIHSDYRYGFSDSRLVSARQLAWGVRDQHLRDGAATRCKTVWLPSSEIVQRDSLGHYVINADGPDTTQVRCVERDFPGAFMGLTRVLKRQTVWGAIAWQGSLVQDGYDASGLSYWCNRYYDLEPRPVHAGGDAVARRVGAGLKAPAPVSVLRFPKVGDPQNEP